MSDGSVFQSIENVLLRIDEIKRKFGVYYHVQGINRSSRFQDELNQITENTEKRGVKSETGEGSIVQGDYKTELDYADIIKAASEQYRLPASLIKAVIKQESNFDQSAISDKGALGLMQLMPETAQLLGVEDPFDVEENIFGGTHYLRQLINIYGGNLNKALGAYNAGPQRVKEEVPDIPETRNFIESVLKYYNSFSKYINIEED
jgi:soluble lytic murein transglycosylase-like protein